MGYKKKIYGSGFEVLKKHENWDLAIWHDSSPKTLVLLHPISEKAFIFADISAGFFSDYKLPYLIWFLCDEDGCIKELTQEQAKEIWDDIWNKKKADFPCKIGDKVYIADCGFTYDCEVANFEWQNGQVKAVMNMVDMYDFTLKYAATDFGKTVFLSKEERDWEHEQQNKMMSENEIFE